MYHYQYEFAEADVFVGIRVFFHEGIVYGKFYTANDCDSMLLQHVRLNEATVGELRMATSTLQEGDVARERAAGQGARLLRGEEHKDFDADVRLQKDVRAQKQETTKDTAARAIAESGVMLCQNCSQPFVRQKCFRAHEDRCVEQSAGRATKRKTVVLRPAADLAQDQVHSAASLSIGQGNLCGGQENKEMFFPTTIKFFPTPRDVGGPKIRERDAHTRMQAKFKDKDEDSDFCYRLVLSESQIKCWFSSEAGRRKKAAANRVIVEGFTELSQSIDIQDNEEGGHDQNKGVVEAGGPPPPPPPPPPPQL
jgi:hypothetical protein